MKRYLIPAGASVLGSGVLTGVYLGILTLTQGWGYAVLQFQRDSGTVVPIIVAFGIQSSLYSILRFQLFVPTRSAISGGPIVGSSGGTSATAMVACCLHHVTNALPILGLSAATAFVARYQRPFLQVSLVVNLIAILVMLAMIMRARQNPGPILAIQ